MAKNLMIGALVLMVIAYVVLGRRDHVPATEAHRLVQQGAVLLDVRTPAEFRAGHIEGATNIPVQELDQRMSELPGKDHPIVVYCKSGGRSASARSMLQSAGYTSLHDLGAMSNWSQADSKVGPRDSELAPEGGR